jgi:outer membrane immunogenic protein
VFVKNLVLQGVAFVALVVGSTAFAADMPINLPVAVHVHSWTGCYIGGNVGYGGSLVQSIAFSGPYVDGFLSSGQFPRSIPVNATGVVVGGQIGCNVQFRQWVLGVETDLQESHLKDADSLWPVPNTGAQFATTSSENRKWFATVRARVGLLPRPQILLYFTGGLAYGDTELSFNTQPGPGVTCAGLPCAAASDSGTHTGWTAGAGLEWMFARNWSVKAEYLYVDLGTRAVTGLTVPSAIPPQPFTATADFREHIARIGVNYTFNWGSAAEPY